MKHDDQLISQLRIVEELWGHEKVWADNGDRQIDIWNKIPRKGWMLNVSPWVISLLLSSNFSFESPTSFCLSLSIHIDSNPVWADDNCGETTVSCCWIICIAVDFWWGDQLLFQLVEIVCTLGSHRPKGDPSGTYYDQHFPYAYVRICTQFLQLRGRNLFLC